MANPKEPPIRSIEDRIAASWLKEASAIADRVAASAGDPPGAERVGNAKAVQMWGTMDPRAPYDTMLQMITTTGIPQDQVPEMLIVKEVPELAQLYATPQQSPVAEQLATLAEFPFRWSLTVGAFESPTEQVQRAEELNKLWLASMPTPPPAPEEPAPTPEPSAAPAAPPPAMMGAAPQPPQTAPQPPMQTAQPLPMAPLNGIGG